MSLIYIHLSKGMVMTAFLLWIGFAILVGVLASRHYNRSGIGYFFVSALLSPLIGAIILLIAGHKNNRKCPYCKERIQQDAIICKHCGKDFTGNLQTSALRDRNDIGHLG